MSVERVQNQPAVAPEVTARSTGTARFTDTAGEAHRSYGISAGQDVLLIVRPDGYIGLATDAGAHADDAHADDAHADDAQAAGLGNPVEQQPEQRVGDLIGAELAGLPPVHRQPQDVAQQPVGEPDIQVGPERASLLAALQLVDPDPLDLPEVLAQVREPGLRAEVRPVVLQHRQGGAVPVQRAAA